MCQKRAFTDDATWHVQEAFINTWLLNRMSQVLWGKKVPIQKVNLFYICQGLFSSINKNAVYLISTWIDG